MSPLPSVSAPAPLRPLGQPLGPLIRTQTLDPAAAAARDRYRAAEATPLVQDLLRRFNAEIVTREPVAKAEWERRFGS